MKVLICDDQDIVRKGLDIVLTHSEGIEVAGLATNGKEAVAMVKQLRPDIVLMDLKMPEMNGVEATAAIKSAFPNTKIIVLTTFDADDWVFGAIKAGANGYLLKDSEGEEIVSAIHETHAGKSIIDPLIAGKVLQAFQQIPANESKKEPKQKTNVAKTDDLVFETLTEREMSILEFMAQGHTNAEIAAAVFLAEGTVKNNVSHIIQKLQANTRTQAIIKALRSGLVEL